MDDVVFGAVVSGRPVEVEGIETIVGLFINTIPVRVKLEDERTFLQLLSNVHRKSVSMQPYEYLPLTEVQALSPLKRNLIDHILTFENNPSEEQFQQTSREGDFGFKLVDRDMYHQSNFDFNLVVIPREVIYIAFIFNTSVYEYDFVEKLEKHLREVIEQVEENPGISLEDIAVTLDLVTSKPIDQRDDGGDFDF